MRLGVQSAVVDGQVVRGDVETDNGRIVAVGREPAGRHGVAVPGFIDLQTNGIAGVDFNAADLDGYRHASAALAATGVTSYQPTLISQPVDDLLTGTAMIGKARAAALPGARILGAHLETPFLSREYAGAHDPTFILEPDLQLADRLCDAGPVVHMTVAPERPGGLELVEHLIRMGVRVSLGHSGADAAVAHQAFNLGASAVTHLFNAQRRFAHRDPGVGVTGLTRLDVTVTVIVDQVHLAAETVLVAWLAAGGRLALITDQIAAAAAGPGTYRLGTREVIVTDIDARLVDGTIAGSIVTMDRAVANLVGLGATVPQAVAAASAAPARLIGHPELGTMRPGTPADVVVIEDDLQVVRTLVDGIEVFAA